jgi:L-2-hydroxyglutarate oxidase
MTETDVAIIGGGVVGLAVAFRLGQRFPRLSITVLEKEHAVAQHQTGHNSGVLHSGIYYKPGSLKARNCRLGNLAMREFCRTEGIAFDVCGKVIVAVNESELPALERIYQRGQVNGVPCEKIGPERLAELEPHAAGVQAIHVPDAGIVDYVQVCLKLVDRIQEAGGRIVASAKVTRIVARQGVVVLETTAGEFGARHIVNCTGLHCDRVTRLAGIKPDAKIVPFRGEFFKVRPEAAHLVNNLIYPVPDPAFPFLGVHFTRIIEGGMECGPNAVLAFAREGYRKTDVNLRDLAESLSYVGFLKLAAKYWRVGAAEMWRSLSKRAFVRELQRLVPEIRAEHLETAPSGVRAQAVAPDGSMVDDFLIHETPQAIHVLNAPSPAATSSLNIGDLIVDKLAPRLS